MDQSKPPSRHLKSSKDSTNARPRIALACAAIGLLERRCKKDDELCAFLQQRDSTYEGDRQFDTALVYLKRYLPTLLQAEIHAIQQILSSTAFAQRRSTGPLTQSRRRTGLVKNFKLAHLRTRTTTTGSAPSFPWLQALTHLHLRLCGAIPRYALLRWAIGGESDCAFWKRFHKLGYCVCGCGKLADTYPQCLTQTPLAEHHYAVHQSSGAHTPITTSLRSTPYRLPTLT